MRICFFGDSFVNGTGDCVGLGWVGAICAQARAAGRDLTAYNLGIRRDTSADILSRWRREAEARLPSDVDGRLVFSFGVNDCTGTEVRVAPHECLANAAAILTEAAGWKPTLMVGPPPVADCTTTDGRVRSLSRDFALLCGRLGVPYLDLHSPLTQDTAWRDEALAGDGCHPSGSGYAKMAALVAAWPAWQGWLYSPDATDPN